MESHFFGRPRFFFPVRGSIGLLPLGRGTPFSSTILRFGAGTEPSGRGFGGLPLFFFPVSGSMRFSACPSPPPEWDNMCAGYPSLFSWDDPMGS